MTYAIPAATLYALGRLRPKDPALVLEIGRTDGHPASVTWHPGLHESFRDVEESNRPTHKLWLPHCGAAFARVLFRHWGLPLAHALDFPSLERVGSGWVLGAIEADVLLTHAPADQDPDHYPYRLIPTLADLTDPAEVLAEVVVWEASKARLRKHGHLLPPDGLHDPATDDLEDLAAMERQAGLTPWTVETLP